MFCFSKNKKFVYLSKRCNRGSEIKHLLCFFQGKEHLLCNDVYPWSPALIYPGRASKYEVYSNNNALTWMHSYVPNLWLRLLYFTWWLCSLRQWCEEYNNVHKPLLWDLALFLTNQSGGGQSYLGAGFSYFNYLAPHVRKQNKGPLHQTTSSPVSLYSWINIKGALQYKATSPCLDY